MKMDYNISKNFLLKFRHYIFSNKISRALHSRTAIYRQECNPLDEMPTCSPIFGEVNIPDPAAIDPKCGQPKVVIVGAGMAGISAAQRLVKCGIKSVRVLEGLDRPGGRIRTLNMAGKPVELGAQWIEGCCIANPIVTLAIQEGLLKHPVPKINSKQGVYLRSSGEVIEDKILAPVQRLFDKINKHAQSLFSLSWEPHGSLYEFMSKSVKKAVQEFPEYQKSDVMRIFNNKLNGIRSRWGDDPNKMAAAQFGSYRTNSYNNTFLPSGFDGILKPLLKDLPDSCLRLNRHVCSIKWDPTGTVAPRAVVTCTNGEFYPADYVIITVSLGVLKTTAHKLFFPNLPEERLECIQKLGFGFINKVFFEFDRAFWVCKEGCIKPTWTHEEIAKRPDWIKSLSMIEEAPGCNSMLLCTVGGKEAFHIERHSEEKLAEDLTVFLRKTLQDPTIPFPRNVLKSKWISNRHFFGSVSYMGLHSLEGHQLLLGSPLPSASDAVTPILLFAGEATAPGYFSTVQGARLSGLREADRILELTKSFGGPPKCAEFIESRAP